MNTYKIKEQFPTFKKIYKKLYENMVNGKYPKVIFDYCFRIIVFLILERNFFLNLMFPMYDCVFNNIFKQPMEDLFLDIGTFVTFSIMCHTYVTVKLCGLFKKINHLNFFIALTIVIAIDFLFHYSKSITIQLFPLKMGFSNHFEIFLIVLPCFIIFKFFNILAEMIPTPFKQIGYFFSIEFYKDLYKKLLNKFKSV